MARLMILPQEWVEGSELLPDGWFEKRASGLLKKIPELTKWIDEICKHVGVSWKLLATRMELEQSAISYPWDGSTTQYEGGIKGEMTKLRYLCGVDKTDSGPRQNGWFEPRRQMLGCALRFKYWYRGINPSGNWKNWLGLKEDPSFKAGSPITRMGITITPENQISADCFRYTSGINAQLSLAKIARNWFQVDFDMHFGRSVIMMIDGSSIEGEVFTSEDNIVVEKDNKDLATIPFFLIESITKK